MPSARIDLEGQDALIARLNRLRGAVRSRMVLRVMEKAGSILLGPMKAAAPVGRTGNLRRSITMMVRSMNAGRCAAEIFTGVWEDVGTPERLRALNAGLDGPLG